MIYLVVAIVGAVILVTWLILSATDGAWWAVGLFWFILACAIIICWLFVKGMSEVKGIAMTEQIREHWKVVSRTYPGVEFPEGVKSRKTVTEWEFGNGVHIQYDPEVGGMYIYLPVPESILSCGRNTETLRDITEPSGVLVNVDRINGALVGIEIIKSES